MAGLAPPPLDRHERFLRVLGDELKAARRRRGWYRRDLLDHIDDDAPSLQAIATWELGTRAMTVARLAQLCLALDVTPMDIVQPAYEKVFTPPSSWIIDLAVAAHLTDPQLTPLANWAATHLPARHRSGLVAHLDRAALTPLATLCGLTVRQLADRLPTTTQHTVSDASPPLTIADDEK